MTYVEFLVGLAEAVRTQNMVNISNYLLEVQRADPTLGYHVAEKCLREKNANVYLVARPARTCPVGLDVRDVRQDPVPYYVWIVISGTKVNGPEEVAAILAHDGVAPTENLANLSRCGALTLPQTE